MSHQINFVTHAQDMQSHYRRIIDGDESINWVIFGYDKASNDLKVSESGNGGLDELVEEFEGSKIQYALVRVKDPNSGLPKVVLIAWCGQGVPVLKKGLFSSHLNDVCSYFKGYNIQINARSEDDLDSKSIMQKVKDSSGAKYSIQEGNKPHLKSSSSAPSKQAPTPSFAPKPSAPTAQKPSYTPSRPNYTPPAVSSAQSSYKPPSTTAPAKPSSYTPSIPSRPTPTPVNKPSLKAPSVNNNTEEDEDPSLAGLSPSQIRAKQAREAREAELRQFSQLRNAKQDEEVKREEEKREQARNRAGNERIERERQEREREERERQRQMERERDERERREKEERLKQLELEREREREREEQNRRREQERIETEKRRREQQEREEEERKRQEAAEEEARNVQAEAEAEAARVQMENMKVQSDHGYLNGTGVTAVALYDYDAAESNELTIREGEIITNIEKMDDGWWFGRIADREGLFPANYVEEKPIESAQTDHLNRSTASYPDSLSLSQSQSQPQPEPTYDQPSSNLLTCVALYDFTASEDNEISFNEGQKIVEVDVVSDDWWCGTVEETGMRGYFPKTYVDVV